ncbi:ATP-grasp domain-containing protein [Burkholderia sp. 22PA0106]|uniref:ATP-grasp domain-containing protein n=1 Tax=Burkholderia sp. 22PA0106 TaxID=3237371 RepID=UPI0039C33963
MAVHLCIENIKAVPAQQVIVSGAKHHNRRNQPQPEKRRMKSPNKSMKVAVVTAANMPKPDVELGTLCGALKRSGCEPAVVAWDAADVAWQAFDLVLIKSPWDYFGRQAAFMQWVTAVSAQTTLRNAKDIILWNVDKRYLLDLESAGVPVIPTVYVPAGEDRHDQRLAPFGHDEVVIKPAVSIGAIGALRARASSKKAHDHLRTLAARGNVLVQPFIESVLDEGEVSLLYFGGAYSHAVRKRARQGDYRVQDHHGGSVEAHTVTEMEMETGRLALQRAPGVPLLARVDLVSIGGRPHVIELELIEPALFLDTNPDACARLAEAVVAELLR